MLEQALRKWALAHQAGTVDAGWRYSRPSIHFWVEEGRLTLNHSPGRSLAQIGLEEIYGLLKLAAKEGWTINIPQERLREELREIDTSAAHTAATEETGFRMAQSAPRFGRDFHRLTRVWVSTVALIDAAARDYDASHGEATPRSSGFMIMSDHERASLERPARAYVEAVKRHLVFP